MMCFLRTKPLRINLSIKSNSSNNNNIINSNSNNSSNIISTTKTRPVAIMMRSTTVSDTLPMVQMLRSDTPYRWLLVPVKCAGLK